MKKYLFIVLVLALTILSPTSNSYAEQQEVTQSTLTNSQLELLVGSWYIPEPYHFEDQGVAISFYDVKANYSADFSLSGSMIMKFVSGPGVKEMKQNNISLEYDMQIVGKWAIKNDILEEEVKRLKAAPINSNMLSQGIAKSMEVAALSQPNAQYQIINVSKTNLKVIDLKYGLAMEYTRAVD